MPYYTYKGKNGRHLVESIRQLVRYTGKSERQLYRVMNGVSEYFEKNGLFVIEKWELERDGRKNNGNIKNFKNE